MMPSDDFVVFDTFDLFYYTFVIIAWDSYFRDKLDLKYLFISFNRNIVKFSFVYKEFLLILERLKACANNHPTRNF